MNHSREEHRLLALWAAGWAEQALPLFEERHSADPRPRQAVTAAREWADGKIPVREARRRAFAAHAAAREATTLSARAAARAAGHAAATAHVAGHARNAAAYALKASAGHSALADPPSWPPLPASTDIELAVPAPCPRPAGTKITPAGPDRNEHSI